MDRMLGLCVAIGLLVGLGAGCSNPYCSANYDFCRKCGSSSESDCSSDLDKCNQNVSDNCSATDTSKLNSVGECIQNQITPCRSSDSSCNSQGYSCNAFGYIGCLMGLGEVSSTCLTSN